MANYSILNKYEKISPESIWEKVIGDIGNNKVFYSSSKKIEYKAEIKNNSIFFKGGKEGSKRSNKEQPITKKDFFDACKEIQNTKITNTNKIKKGISNNFIATPLIGLLLTSEIIKKVE